MGDGYVKLFRRMLDWEWYDDANTKSLFIHCLLSANYKPAKWRGVDIPAGSFITSTLKLSEETGISRQSIRTSLTRLKSTNEITYESTNRFTIINVMKWADYQSLEDGANQQNNKPSNNQLTINQPATNHKQEVKKDKNEKNKETTTSDFVVREGWFDTFWNLYPKHVGKQTAVQKFNLRVKTETMFNEIINDLRVRVKSDSWTRDEGRYIPNPTTYLNQARWTDELVDRVGQTKVKNNVPMPNYWNQPVEEQGITEEEKQQLFLDLEEARKKL